MGEYILPYNNYGFVSKDSEEISAKIAEKCGFLPFTVVWRLLSREAREYPHKPYIARN